MTISAQQQQVKPKKPAGVRLRQLFNNGRGVLSAYWYLRRAAYLGRRVRLWGRPVIHAAGRLIIHDRVQLISTITPLELAVGPGAQLEIGERCYINYGCSIAALQHVSIGPRCSIGTYVNIMDNNFHRLEPERRDERPASAPVVLDENVWLGARVIVLPGVTIGAGSAVAAGSVVTGDIPARSLAAGVPARVIRTL